MGLSRGSFAHHCGPGFKFSTVQISKSPNSLLLFPDYTPCSSPQSFVVLLSLFQNNEERWKSLPVVILTHIFVRLLIKSIIICTSVSKTWKSKSKTQLSFPTISTTPTTKTKTSSSSGWQKKKKVGFFTYDFITNDNNKEVYTLHNENDDDPDADFSQLLMGLCIGLPSRQILIKNLIFLFWCSIWRMKCSAKYCCQNFQLMGIRLPCFTRSMKVSVTICG